MGLNQFSDMTFAEFRKHFLWSEPQVKSHIQENSDNSSHLVLSFFLDSSLVVVVAELLCHQRQLHQNEQPSPGFYRLEKKGKLRDTCKGSGEVETEKNSLLSPLPCTVKSLMVALHQHGCKATEEQQLCNKSCCFCLIKMKIHWTIPSASIAKEQQLSFLVYSFADCLLVSIRMCGFLFLKKKIVVWLCCREAAVVAGPFPLLAAWSL